MDGYFVLVPANVLMKNGDVLHLTAGSYVTYNSSSEELIVLGAGTYSVSNTSFNMVKSKLQSAKTNKDN